MEQLPIVYVRGYAGPTAGINTAADDPFYGFNNGATHVRVDGDGDPRYYQFEGPLLRLMGDEGYRLLVQGDQHQFLLDAEPGQVPAASLWIYRFYDQAATTFTPPPHHNIFTGLFSKLHQDVTSDGFDIETAAAGLYDLITLIRHRTGAPQVYLVAHSMGGLVARCMMQKICLRPDAAGASRLPARDLVSRFFTYGTPHGGIAFQVGALNWAEEAFGPAGSDIFAPEKMYGYLTPNATFGDLPPDSGDKWNPQAIPESVFDVNDVFCLIGTDPKDYGLSRVVVGPKSDGLVMIEHAYVAGAHRAYVYKSHSGTYGEVNSEEGYQNLRRFLFGRWQVAVNLIGLPRQGDSAAGSTWQADMMLTIRGLPIVLTEQLAEHYCPIQLNDAARRLTDNPDHPVPLVTTFLLDQAPAGPAAAEQPHGGRLRYSLSLKVFTLSERKVSAPGGAAGQANGAGQRSAGFRFADHLEQVGDWSDTLIVDVGPDPDGTGLAAWAAWNSAVQGSIARFDPITDGLPNPADRHAAELTPVGADHTFRIQLPEVARTLPILGPDASLVITVTDRHHPAVAPPR